jgi:hypothetical protein
MPPPENLDTWQQDTLDTFDDDDDLDFTTFEDPFFLWYVEMTKGKKEAQKMLATPKETNCWPGVSRYILFMNTRVQEKIDGIDNYIEASLHFPDIFAQAGVGGNDGTLKECQHPQVVADLREIPNEIKEPKEVIGKLEQERNHRIVCNFSIAITCVAFLLSSKAAGSRVPNPWNPTCQRVHFTPLRECDSGKLCTEPVGAPPGTRFFAYDLQPGVVLCPDTGNVTVPASALDSKHGRAPFHVFAESPDEFGAPGYVQSVEVRHEELLVQPDSIAQTVSKAAATALGVSAGYVLYWLVTQND